MKVGSTLRTTASLPLLQRLARFKGLGEGADLLLQAFEPFAISGFAAWIALDHDRVDPLTNVISSWPGDWLRSYIDEKRYFHDPVVQRATEKPGHFFWHDLHGPTSPEAIQLMCDAAACGLVDGFTLSWRSSGPVSTILSLSGGPLKWSSLDVAVAAAMADTFLLRTVFVRDRIEGIRSNLLSPQERRILCLAAEGLTDHEIAQQLGLRRGTVVTHWRRARLKLGASTRTQAVARGLGLGEIVF
jgi:DNA-binding CsgD family transcriptional regulator